jgi:Family of unknown function (DUF5706)
VEQRNLKARTLRDLFFGHIANFKNGNEFLARVVEAASEPERVLNGMATEAWILAQNTRRKHRLVDVAVVFTGLALMGTLIVGWLNFSTAL